MDRSRGIQHLGSQFGLSAVQGRAGEHHAVDFNDGLQDATLLKDNASGGTRLASSQDRRVVQRQSLHCVTGAAIYCTLPTERHA